MTTIQDENDKIDFRSSVDRIANRAGLKNLYLGEGKNGIVGFIRKEVEAYEARITS